MTKLVEVPLLMRKKTSKVLSTKQIHIIMALINGVLYLFKNLSNYPIPINFCLKTGSI